MGNEGRKLKKRRKNKASLSLFIPPTPINPEMGHENGWNFLWWKSLPKTQMPAKKNHQKSIYHGTGALALILALIAISKA